ncbi:MAG TPA: hypothetical protein DCM40_28600, partial [Maribacter sp.]|nr:hypothetical protein [Maribacter sp.]
AEEFNTIAKKGPFFDLGDITSKVSQQSNAAGSIMSDLGEAWEPLQPEEAEQPEPGYFDEGGTGVL